MVLQEKYEAVTACCLGVFITLVILAAMGVI